MGQRIRRLSNRSNVKGTAIRTISVSNSAGNHINIGNRPSGSTSNTNKRRRRTKKK